MKKIAITTGDQDGIGFEVTAKALASIGPQKSCTFYVFRAPNASASLLRRIGAKFRRREFTSWSEAFSYRPKKSNELIDIISMSPPARWVETAGQACRLGTLDAMVTAPLSKQAILSCGMRDIGHTDILKRLCGSNQAYMGFVGNKFNVVLATGHIPLSAVAQDLTVDKIIGACRAAFDLRAQLPVRRRKLPIGLLGLNPHAGDGGIISTEEGSIFSVALERLAAMQIPVVGPLVPDAAFLKEAWSKYSSYVACYHDQGLIPFKAIHGFDSGTHLTLGLPLKRTSVDHGTAKDIFGKNKANPGSMVSALRWAINWV